MESIKYRWERNTVPVSPDVAAVEFERISRENGGILEPQKVVEAARPKNSPLHNIFEWDDRIASEKYRRYQAQETIRMLKVEILHHEPKTRMLEIRAYSHIRTKETAQEDGDKQNYVSILCACNSPIFKQQLLKDALKDVRHFESKYKLIGDMPHIKTLFEAMERFKEHMYETKPHT